MGDFRQHRWPRGDGDSAAVSSTSAAREEVDWTFPYLTNGNLGDKHKESDAVGLHFRT